MIIITIKCMIRMNFFIFFSRFLLFCLKKFANKFHLCYYYGYFSCFLCSLINILCARVWIWCREAEIEEKAMHFMMEKMNENYERKSLMLSMVHANGITSSNVPIIDITQRRKKWKINRLTENENIISLLLA